MVPSRTALALTVTAAAASLAAVAAALAHRRRSRRRRPRPGAAPVLVLVTCSQSSTLKALARTASCLGVRAVVLVGKSARLDERRLDAGVATVRCATFAEARAVLRDRYGVDCLVALEIGAAAVPLQKLVRQTVGRSVAVVAGHEQQGHPAEALAACDAMAVIPHRGPGAPSLTLATAVSIAVFCFADGHSNVPVRAHSGRHRHQFDAGYGDDEANANGDRVPGMARLGRPDPP